MNAAQLMIVLTVLVSGLLVLLGVMGAVTTRTTMRMKMMVMMMIGRQGGPDQCECPLRAVTKHEHLQVRATSYICFRMCGGLHLGWPSGLVYQGNLDVAGAADDVEVCDHMALNHTTSAGQPTAMGLSRGSWGCEDMWPKLAICSLARQWIWTAHRRTAGHMQMLA